MGRPRKLHACAGCGELTPRRGRATDGVRCVKCSIERHEQATLQINAGSGEFYERWLFGLERAIAKRVAALAPPDNGDGGGGSA